MASTYTYSGGARPREFQTFGEGAPSRQPGRMGTQGWAGPAPQAPSMPFNFNMNGGASGGSGGAPGGGPPGPPEGLPSELGNPEDMTQRNIMAARDAGTAAMKEYQGGLMGRLGPGGTAPGAMTRISRETMANLNKGALDAAFQNYAQKTQAYGAGTDRYNATTNAWNAGQQAALARERISLDSQIAAMNAMLGMWSPMMSMMGQSIPSVSMNLG